MRAPFGMTQAELDEGFREFQHKLREQYQAVKGKPYPEAVPVAAPAPETPAAFTALEARVTALEQALAALQATRSTRFTPPDPAEVTAYASSIGYALDGHAFCDFYAARGWVVGKTKMKDWRAAVRTWRGKDAPIGGKPVPARPQMR